MLRIEAQEGDMGTMLTLQGDVIGLWVGELQRSCDSARVSGNVLTVDLTDVGFVDCDGVDLLRRLQDRGVLLANAPRFVLEQLKATTR